VEDTGNQSAAVGRPHRHTKDPTGGAPPARRASLDVHAGGGDRGFVIRYPRHQTTTHSTIASDVPTQSSTHTFHDVANKSEFIRDSLPDAVNNAQRASVLQTSYRRLPCDHRTGPDRSHRTS